MFVEPLTLLGGITLECFEQGRVVAVIRILDDAHLDDFADRLTLLDHVSAARDYLFTLSYGLVALCNHCIAGAPQQKAEAGAEEECDAG